MAAATLQAAVGPVGEWIPRAAVGPVGEWILQAGGDWPTVLDLYNMAVSLLAAVGLLYLLYSGRYVVNYRRFFQIVALGLFVSLLGGSFVVFLPNAARHAIHGVATLVIAAGLYDLVRGEVPGRNVDWTVVLYSDPREVGGVTAGENEED